MIYFFRATGASSHDALSLSSSCVGLGRPGKFLVTWPKGQHWLDKAMCARPRGLALSSGQTIDHDGKSICTTTGDLWSCLIIWWSQGLAPSPGRCQNTGFFGSMVNRNLEVVQSKKFQNTTLLHEKLSVRNCFKKLRHLIARLLWVENWSNLTFCYQAFQLWSF